MMIPIRNKICRKCALYLDIGEFRKDKTRKDGYEYVCRRCKKDHRGKYRNIGVRDFIEIPIMLNFDENKIIGQVRIDKEFKYVFSKMAISAGYIKNEDGRPEITHFGLVKTLIL